MVGVIINVVLTVLLVGAILFIITKNNLYHSLDEDYFDLAERHEQTCKELDLARRENKVLQEENARLNQAPKVEKVSKPRTRKTTKK